MSVKKSFAAASKRTLFHLAMLTAVLAAAAIACGVESGDRRPARQGESETLEFHRSPVTAFEQFRMDLAKDDASCSIEPSDVAVNAGDRVRLAIQLPLADIQQGATGSLEVTGDKQTLQLKIDGLEISASGGALGTGVTEFDREIESGSRVSYDFNASNAGVFDILCDGGKIGTFTVN